MAGATRVPCGGARPSPSAAPPPGRGLVHTGAPWGHPTCRCGLRELSAAPARGFHVPLLTFSVSEDVFAGQTCFLSCLALKLGQTPWLTWRPGEQFQGACGGGPFATGVSAHTRLLVSDLKAFPAKQSI